MTTTSRRAAPAPLPDPGPLRPMIDSWELSLHADGKTAGTIRTYTDAVIRLAGWLATPDLSGADIDDWSQVSVTHLRGYMAWFQQRYSKGYANNQYRALQQFLKWYAAEEDAPNPMQGMRPPAPGSKVIPVLSEADLAAIIRAAEKGRDFESRRDAALLRFLACTGCRLAEVAGLSVAHVDVRTRQARVLGKGNRERVVRFDAKAALALDRYLRLRSRHRYASIPQLWLGATNRGAMTGNGIGQMVQRRGEQLGLHLHPHMFRHTFTHRWLDAGGAEGDLMELNGWNSPAMLRRYGASARNARAHRAYDRINVMGDV